jgi:hypothetical protein
MLVADDYPDAPEHVLGRDGRPIVVDRGGQLAELFVQTPRAVAISTCMKLVKSRNPVRNDIAR